jgi:hypothetical protein
MITKKRFKPAILIAVGTILFTVGVLLIFNVSSVLSEQSLGSAPSVQSEMSERISNPSQQTNTNIKRVEGDSKTILGKFVWENNQLSSNIVPVVMEVQTTDEGNSQTFQSEADSQDTASSASNQTNDQIITIKHISKSVSASSNSLSTLQNGTYYLVAYGDPNSPTTEFFSSYTFKYDASKKVSVRGTLGCDRFSGSLAEEGSYIKFTLRMIFNSRSTCSAKVTQQADTVLNLMKNIKYFEQKSNEAFVFTTGGGKVLVYSSNPPEAGDPIVVRSTAEPTLAPTAAPTSAPPSAPSGNAFYVSTSGSDSNPGSYQKPWRTINKAAQSLSSGQTAIVLAGTYPERINLSRSGIILKAEGKVLMRGFDVTGNSNQVIGFIISDKNSDAGLEVHGDNNLFQNNEIYHMGQDGIWFHGSGNTYRGNYIHDILDPSIGGDPHVDCFQSWTWGGPVKNTLFEGNTCNHTRSSGSNQITMIESKNGEISNLVFRNNTFTMHDAGYTPLRVNRKDGQYPIYNLQVVNNTFKNVTGNGNEAISFVSVTDSEISGNTVTGFDEAVKLSSCSNVTVYNNGSTTSPTPSPTATPKPSATPVQPTATSAPSSSAYYVSTSGSDKNPGTYEKPWRTINKAAQTLSSGQTAIVLAGNYPERIKLSSDGIIAQSRGQSRDERFRSHGNNNQDHPL